MKKLLSVSFLFFLSVASASAQAGVSLGGTRLIFDGNKKETSLTVYSNEGDTHPYLIHSFLDNNGEKGDKINNEKPPFIVTPPLFRLEPGKENAVRVVKAGAPLPEDRESVFWLNVRAIPGTNKNQKEENTLKLTLKNRIKLFYRPSALVKGKESETFSGVTFTHAGSGLIVRNPTPYFISFSSLRVGGKNVNTDFIMVPPKGESRYLMPVGVSGNSVEWSYITDYGSASNTLKGSLKYGS